MTAIELYDLATKQGLRLEARGDKLAVIPRDRVSPDLAETLRQHKTELLDWLSRPRGWQALPPDNLPLSPDPPSPTARDRKRMIAYLLGQGCDRPGELTAWLVRRENDYFAGPGAKWDCGLICYAAARDAACWQLNRSECDVLELLAGCDECSGKGPPL